jgi:hypothetical protein
VSTGQKYVYFSIDESKFNGFRTQSIEFDFLLDILSYDEIKKNKINNKDTYEQKDDKKQKYLKYKLKYLALKATIKN